MAQKPQPDQDKKRPVASFGPYQTDRNTSLEVAVWENLIMVQDREITTFNVTVKRSYRDDGGAWHANAAFRPHDLPVLLHAVGKAYDWIMERKNPANGE